MAWWEVAVPEAVVLVGTLVMLAVIDPVLAVTALAVCPALAVVIVLRRRLVRRAQGRAREQEGRLSEHAQDLIRNVRVVQAFGRQPEMNLAFDRLSQRARRANVSALTVEARLAPLADLILALGSAGVLVLGAVRVQQGAMTTGTLLVGLTYVAGLYVPLRSLTSLAATLARAEASRDRLREVFADPGRRPADGLPVRDLRGDVALESVRFGYDDTTGPRRRRPRLRGRTRDGADRAHGGGQETVLNLLLRFEDPWSGWSPSVAATCGCWPSTACAVASPTSPRSRGSSTTRSATTSRSASRRPPTRRSARRPTAPSSPRSPSAARRARHGDGGVGPAALRR